MNHEGNFTAAYWVFMRNCMQHHAAYENIFLMWAPAEYCTSVRGLQSSGNGAKLSPMAVHKDHEENYEWFNFHENERLNKGERTCSIWKIMNSK